MAIYESHIYLQVTLVSPVVPKDKGVTPDCNISINESGNIVWRSLVEAGATESFLLHYTIERPVDRNLEFNEV